VLAMSESMGQRQEGHRTNGVTHELVHGKRRCREETAQDDFDRNMTDNIDKQGSGNPNRKVSSDVIYLDEGSQRFTAPLF
jgi:hypothetical protein